MPYTESTATITEASSDMADKATIKDVAAKAGVSTSLVSFVFNNRAHIRPSTAERVRKTAALLGYKPSSEDRKRGPKPGSKRKRQRTALKKVCLLTAAGGSPWQSPFYSKVSSGVERAANAMKCELTVQNVTSPDEFSRLLKNSIDGIITLSGDKELLLKLRQHCPLPVIAILGIPEPFNYFDYVTYDNSLVGKLAAEHLLKKGHTRLAVFHPAGDINLERAATFSAAVSAAGCQSASYLVTSSISEDLKRMEEMLKRRPAPTAMFCASDAIAAQMYQFLYQKKLKPGSDLEIVSCNKDVPILAVLQPKPATIDLHTEMIGCQAVRQLMWRKENPDAPRTKLIINPELVEPDEY